MNIYKHEFKMSIKSVVIWSIAVAMLIFVFMTIFSAMAPQAALLNEAMAQMPPELLMAFGMTGMDLATVLGFYGLAFTFIQICIALQAANYGFSLVSVEETDMTADFLLAKPISRPRILTDKLLSAITGLTITNLVVWITSLVLVNVYAGGQPFDTRTLLLLLLSIAVFQLVFLTVGMLISLLVKRVRNVIAFSMALVFGMYVLSAFGSMLGDDKLDVITPFKHFDPNYIISHGAYDLPMVLISVAFILISVVGSYRLYTRRNIQTAM